MICRSIFLIFIWHEKFWIILLAHNVLALGEEADFEALNCLPALNLIRSTKLHLSTEPAFLPNACYMPLFYSFSVGLSNVGYPSFHILSFEVHIKYGPSKPSMKINS